MSTRGRELAKWLDEKVLTQQKQCLRFRVDVRPTRSMVCNCLLPANTGDRLWRHTSPRFDVGGSIRTSCGVVLSMDCCLSVRFLASSILEPVTSHVWVCARVHTGEGLSSMLCEPR